MNDLLPTPARLICVLLGLTASLAVAAGEAPPVKIIVDTDMATDCDDAGALAVLHALADNGECKILATVVSSKNRWSVPTVNVINTYYGRPGLPIGAVKGPGVQVDSRYTQQLAQEFPHAIQTDDDVPDSVQVYRDVLERQPDQSVVVATIGYLTNLKGLLQLPADSGHVSGLELARKKVKTWVCMGGNFIGSPARDDLKLGNVNFQRDAASAFYTINHWPGPIVFVGREVASVPSGVTVGQNLVNTAADNPVRQAYFHYFNGTIKSRHVADLATVLYAVRGLRDYWDIQDKGYMDLKPDMTFEWKFDQDKNQAYLLKKKPGGQSNDSHIEEVLDKLLCQPPASARK
jgi:inosine-uridine nucleoside N-ribohydrolase